MAIQPVLIHNTFFAKGKRCGSEGFCIKPTACLAKKGRVSERKEANTKSCSSKKNPLAENNPPETKSCGLKKRLMAKAQDNQSMSCKAKKQLIAEAKSCNARRVPEPDTEEPEKGCTKKDCGPFTICSSCCIIPMNRPVFSFSYFVQKTEKPRLINENISSNYISDLWHPPEFI